MFANRMFYVLIVLALVAAIFFTYQQAASAGALARAGSSHAQADQVQSAILRGHRGGMNPDLFLYGQSVTTSGVNKAVADRSYDAIEEVRVQR
jgi:hypothetical protein